MTAVTEMGGVVMPPVPAFYLRPQCVDDIVHHTAARALDLLDVDVPGTPRWGETDLDLTSPNPTHLTALSNSTRRTHR
jgi:3-polyprenyl-4-hydroxybenzoate decarboxylase